MDNLEGSRGHSRKHSKVAEGILAVGRGGFLGKAGEGTLESNPRLQRAL